MMMSSPRNPDRLDDRLRALHRQAVQAVPWQLQARLQPRSATQRATVSPARRPLLLASAAGLLAVAMTLLILPRSADRPATASVPTALSVPAVVDADSADALGADPDFYAWLASADAGLLAME